MLDAEYDIRKFLDAMLLPSGVPAGAPRTPLRLRVDSSHVYSANVRINGLVSTGTAGDSISARSLANGLTLL
jgi:hypothetical protein